MVPLRRCLLAFTCLVLTSRAEAAIISSTWFSSSDGDWSNPIRWSTNPTVPDNTAADVFDVVLGGEGAILGVSVKLDSPRTVQNLFQRYGLSAEPGTALRVTGTYDFAGFLTGPSVTVDGMFKASGGKIQPSSVLTLPKGSVNSINGLFNVGGTIEQHGSMQIKATILGAGVIRNDNSVTITGTSTIGPRFENTGRLTVEAGELTFMGGGFSTEDIFVSPAAQLTLTSNVGAIPYDFSQTTIVGGGALLVQSGSTHAVGRILISGTTTIAGDVTVSAFSTFSRLEMNGGSLGGAGHIALTDMATWRGGTLKGSDMTVSAFATLNTVLGGFSPVTLQTTLVNEGTININSQGIGGSGTIDNRSLIQTFGTGFYPNPGFTILPSVTNQASGQLTSHRGELYFGPETVLLNHGNILVRGGAGLRSVGASVTNSGIITVQSTGILSLEAKTVMNGPGGIITATGALVTLGGNWTNQGTISLTDSTLRLGGTFDRAGLGTIVRNGNTAIEITGQMNNAGGAWEVNGSTGRYDLVAGSKIVGGAVHVTADGELAGEGLITGLVELAGKLAPGTKLTIEGDLMIAPTSTLAFDLGWASDSIEEGGGSALQLAGSLRLRIKPGTFAPPDFASTVIEILKSNEPIGGAFANAPSGSRIVTDDGQGSFRVDYAGQTRVTLSEYQAVPEPSVPGLLALAASERLLWRHRRRSAQHSSELE